MATRRWQRGLGRSALTAALALPALGVAFSSAAANPGGAEPALLELTWSAPRGCPDEAAVRERVERLLHAPLRLREGARLVVRATVTPPVANGSWQVDLEMLNAAAASASDPSSSRRSIQAASCDELAGATALVLAILVQPERDGSAGAAPSSAAPAPVAPAEAPSSGSSVLAGSADAAAPADAPRPEEEGPAPSTVAPPALPAPSEPAASGAAPAPSAPPAAAASSRSDRSGPTAQAKRITWVAGLQAGISGGYLPSWSPGVGLDLGLEGRWFRAMVGGFVWAPSKQAVDTTTSDFQLYSAHAQVCLQVPVGTWAFGPCGGAELAALRGSGNGGGLTSDPHTAQLFAGLLGGFARWALVPRLSLGVDLEAVVPARTPGFVYTDGTRVHQTAPLGARFALLGEIRL